VVLGVKLDLAIAKVDRDLIVVVIELAEARDCSINSRLVSGDLLLVFRQLRLARFQPSISFGQLGSEGFVACRNVLTGVESQRSGQCSSGADRKTGHGTPIICVNRSGCCNQCSRRKM
jgi:hypothetical protein